MRAGHPSKIKALDLLVKERQRNEAWITKQKCAKRILIARAFNLP